MNDHLRKAFDAFLIASGHHVTTGPERDRMFRAFCAGIMTSIQAAKDSKDDEAWRQWLKDVLREIDENFSDVSKN